MSYTDKQPGIGVVIHQPLRDRLYTVADQSRLNTLGRVAWTEEPHPLTINAAVAVLRDCEIGIGSWGSPSPCPELLEACPQLKLWVHTAGSVKYMFGPHLEGRSLTIASCKPALADVVAEMTLGQIILGLRRVFENAVANRAGIVGHPPHLKVLMGSTIGVVGASLIGRRVIKLLKPFGCDVLLYDPYVSAEEAFILGAAKVERLTDLCGRSDVVTLHTPDIPATNGLMGAAEFAAMRDDAIFINTARGACVDEDALIRALSQGRLQAFLDVTLPEPPSIDSPFRKLANVVYTSHIAGPPCFNLGRQAVDDIEAYLQGGTPQYVVTPEMLGITA